MTQTNSVAGQAPMGTDGRSGGGEMEQLRSDVAKLRGDVQALVNHGVELAQAQVRAAKDAVHGRIDAVKQRGVDSMNAAGQSVSDHPVRTVVIAVVAGYVLAKILD